MSILLAVISMSVLALLLGIGLGYAAKRFAVPVDPRIEEAIGAMPGANCGGCGFPGCGGLVKAVARGETKPNVCAPGGSAVAKRLSEIFGLEASGGAPKVAQVRCRVGADPDWEKFEYDHELGCGTAMLLAGGVGTCDFGCVGMLDCVKACPFGALSKSPDSKRPPVVDVSRCTGCGICVETCPNRVIALVDLNRQPVVYCRSILKGKLAKGCCIVACIACGKCERNCPEKAVSMQNNLPVIDLAKCTRCGKCIEGCPTKVILMFRDDLKTPAPAGTAPSVPAAS